MSWLHKFFDLFLGESEEDAERETKPAQIPQQQEVHHPEGQLKDWKILKYIMNIQKANSVFQSCLTDTKIMT